MEKSGGGVKVTYIETQFVTSDEASFKSTVQRLTGKSATAAPLHRPRPCRAVGRRSADTAGSQSQQGYCMSSSPAPAGAAKDGMRAAAGRSEAPCVEEMQGIHDFSELFYVDERRHGGGSYSDLLY